jgi:hypothetical protein
MDNYTAYEKYLDSLSDDREEAMRIALKNLEKRLPSVSKEKQEEYKKYLDSLSTDRAEALVMANENLQKRIKERKEQAKEKELNDRKQKEQEERTKKFESLERENQQKIDGLKKAYKQQKELEEELEKQDYQTRLDNMSFSTNPRKLKSFEEIDSVPDSLTEYPELSAEESEYIDLHRLKNAVISNDLETVNELLNSGVNPNQTDETGSSPIFYGLTNPDIVKLLIDSGANVNLVNKEKDTPLTVAILFILKNPFKTLETIKLLLKKGANKNHLDSKNSTALDNLKILISNKNISDNVKNILNELTSLLSNKSSAPNEQVSLQYFMNLSKKGNGSFLQSKITRMEQDLLDLERNTSDTTSTKEPLLPRAKILNNNLSREEQLFKYGKVSRETGPPAAGPAGRPSKAPVRSVLTNPGFEHYFDSNKDSEIEVELQSAWIKMSPTEKKKYGTINSYIFINKDDLNLLNNLRDKLWNKWKSKSQLEKNEWVEKAQAAKLMATAKEASVWAEQITAPTTAGPKETKKGKGKQPIKKDEKPKRPTMRPRLVPKQPLANKKQDYQEIKQLLYEEEPEEYLYDTYKKGTYLNVEEADEVEESDIYSVSSEESDNEIDYDEEPEDQQDED